MGRILKYKQDQKGRSNILYLESIYKLGANIILAAKEIPITGIPQQVIRIVIIKFIIIIIKTICKISQVKWRWAYIKSYLGVGWWGSIQLLSLVPYLP